MDRIRGRDAEISASPLSPNTLPQFSALRKLQSHQVGNLKHEYDVVGDGINQIRFEVDFDKVDILEQFIKNSCHGRVTVSRI